MIQGVFTLMVLFCGRRDWAAPDGCTKMGKKLKESDSISATSDSQGEKGFLNVPHEYPVSYVKDERELTSEFVREILPAVNRVIRFGRIALVFVEQPSFKASIDGTGFDDQLIPFDWIREITGIGTKIAEASKSLFEKLDRYEYTGETQFDEHYPIKALRHACQQCIKAVGDISTEWSDAVEALDVDFDEDIGWYELILGVSSQDGDCVGDPTDGQLLLNRTRQIELYLGSLQRDSLMKLKLAAETAIYAENWYRLIREGLDYPRENSISWSDLEPSQKKIVEFLAKNGDRPKTSPEIAKALKMTKRAVDGQLKTDRKLRSSGIVESIVGKGGGNKLTPFGWTLFNSRPNEAT